MTIRCVLALDLGTSAFKAGIVQHGALVGEPAAIAYDLDHDENGSVSCPIQRYRSTVVEALRGAALAAVRAGVRVDAIGVSSQAQTFAALDATGWPMGPAIVWTDETARDEAEEAQRGLPGFAYQSGFAAPLPAQFLPKVMRAHRADRSAGQYLLLNELVIRELTGVAIGDQTNQGMGGFFDISRRTWSPRALALAGIDASRLARTAPAATISASLLPEVADALGVPRVPVYSCGNDQSCSAAGCGVAHEGEIACTFGTAMVAYAPCDRFRAPERSCQIAGINPLTDRYFLLAFEAGASIAERANQFRALLSTLIPDRPTRLVASGGQTQNDDFMWAVQEAIGCEIERAPHAHAALLGVASIIVAAQSRTPNA